MFVASCARLPPGARFHLKAPRFKFSLGTHCMRCYNQALGYIERPLQCADRLGATSARHDEPTAPQASRGFLRDTEANARCFTVYICACLTSSLKVSRKQTWFVRKRRSKDFRKANEPLVDSIGPKKSPSHSNPSIQTEITEISSVHHSSTQQEVMNPKSKGGNTVCVCPHQRQKKPTHNLPGMQCECAHTFKSSSMASSA